MSLPDTLDHHAEICEAMHQIILDENRRLKVAGNPPDEASLQAKRATLAELSKSLTTIRTQTCSPVTPAIRAAAARAQQTILKALLVDRENEKLLLKAITVPPPPKTASRPPTAHFQRAYCSAP